MQSVLLSVKPKWCELIASGIKTIEIRKTRPKCGIPFKCYIYCTKNGSDIYSDGKSIVTDNLNVLNKKAEKSFSKTCGFYKWNEKVIGEFVCDKIDKIDIIDHELITYIRVNQKADMFVTQETCLGIDELQKYLDNKTGYGWGISNLVIYDKPKELSEFYKYCGDNPDCDGCKAHYYSNTECGLEDYCCSKIDGCRPINRPPQSWGYVEEVK